MSEISEKWGNIVSSHGFTQIPNALFFLNKYATDEMKICPTEMIILLQLLSSWWQKNKMPFLSMKTISEKSSISERQVQRAIKSLELKGYIKKEKKTEKGIIASNIYDLLPLVEKLNIISEHVSTNHKRTIK